jgi:hypothetical protein
MINLFNERRVGYKFLMSAGGFTKWCEDKTSYDEHMKILCELSDRYQ